METKNAVIKDVFIGLEDHNIPAIGIKVDYGCAVQGTGLYDLRVTDISRWVSELCKIFDVRKLNDLVGKPCRVKSDNVSIEELGNFIKEEWFSFEHF